MKLPDKYKQKRDPGRCSYYHLVMENEDALKKLLRDCEMDHEGEHIWFNLQKRGARKEIEIIPWFTEDSIWQVEGKKAENRKTVFVGGLHGTMTATVIKNMMTVSNRIKLHLQI